MKERDHMKTFVKYLFIVVGSMAVGGILGWQAFGHQIRLRFTPLGEVNYVIIASEICPHIDFYFTQEGNTFNGFGNAGNVEDDLDRLLARLALNTTSCWMVASFNRGVTVQQVRDVDARIRSFGFPKPLTLIDDSDGIQEERERLYSEIRISPLPH